MLYIKGPVGKLDVSYDAGHGMLKIHCRWLDFDAMRQEVSYREWFPDTITEKNTLFLCNHAIEELLYLSISSIFKASSTLRMAEMRYIC